MKINFEYSEPLDIMLTEMALQSYTPKQIVEMTEYKKIIETHWKKQESKTTKLIESLSGLKFERDVECFPVKNMEFRAISSPFIIRKEKDLKMAEIIIIHELIHIILTQNKDKVVNYITAIYPNKRHDFKIHVAVLAIQKQVMEKLFEKEFIKNFIKEDEDSLKDAWTEVIKHSHRYKNNIISFLKNENLE